MNAPPSQKIFRSPTTIYPPLPQILIFFNSHQDDSSVWKTDGVHLTFSHRVIRWPYHETGQLQMLILYLTNQAFSRLLRALVGKNIKFPTKIDGLAKSHALCKTLYWIFWALFFKNLSFSRCERVREIKVIKLLATKYWLKKITFLEQHFLHNTKLHFIMLLNLFFIKGFQGSRNYFCHFKFL